ncbi:hypothetical protein ACGFYU_08730 [Streptomyces sp. NPDC048337]|uniref:hypothetical protein n=1 Tax=Streptomyces sp. NPDC048337 TaxID=3365535 RepID=UPI00371E1EF5
MSFFGAHDWAAAASLLGIEYDPSATSARAAIEESGFIVRDLTEEAEAELRRARGREADIPQPFPEVAVRAVEARSLRDAMDDPWRPLWELHTGAERLLRLAVRQRSQTLAVTKSWATAAGWVEMSHGQKRFAGNCLECAREFSVTRPAASSRRWPQICDGCKVERERARKREWARRNRAKVA